MDPHGGFAIALVGLQFHVDMDAADYQHAVFEFDLPYCFGRKSPEGCVNVTRLQRASQGAGQSTRGRGDNVIQCRRVRLEYFRWNLIVLGDRPVNAKGNGLAFRRKPSAADRTLNPFQPDMRAIDDLRHGAAWLHQHNRWLRFTASNAANPSYSPWPN